MKQICIWCLALGLLLGLVGCSPSAPPAESDSNSETVSAVSSEAENSETENDITSDTVSTVDGLSEPTADASSDDAPLENENHSTTLPSETTSTTDTTDTTKHSTTSKPFFTTVVTKPTTTQSTTPMTTMATTKATTTVKPTTKATTTKPTTTVNTTTTGSAAHPYCQQVWTLVNKERVAKGLSPLTYRNDLQSLADIRADEIVESFSHTRPNGTSCFTVFTEANVPYWGIGENIAMGQRSPEEVVEDWMNSDGHRANILGDFDGIVVGYKNNHWVQLFIKAR